MRLRFDRGTIVIDPGAAHLDPVGLPGVAWDPRVAAYRAPASAHAAIVGRLTDAGVPFADEVGRPAGGIAWRVPELRWYQDAALAAWAAAGQRGVVALPTGAGKTMVALAAMARLGCATLCLVPTRILLEQWLAAIASACRVAPAQLGDGAHQVGVITVATYASAISWAPRIGDRFGLVVVDEAHHVGASCPREVLQMLVAPARLGLTATPPDEPADELGPVVYALGIDDLRGDALAEFDQVTVPIRLAPHERERYRALRARFTAAYRAYRDVVPDAPWEAFVAAAMRSADGRAAVAAWRAARGLLAYPVGKQAAVRQLLVRHAAARTLVFTTDNAAAYAIARQFLVQPITHEIGRRERADMIARFRAGIAPVLVSAQVLDEGFDVPDAEIAIVVGGSASARQYVQRLGRVLRPAAGKRARVYELVVQGTSEVAQQQQRHGGAGWS